MRTRSLTALAEPQFRAPSLSDGKTLYQLAKTAGTLDVNSEYAYLLTGHHHADTSVVAEVGGNPAGFVSGYWVPQSDDRVTKLGKTLFVWQVGVHPDYRGQGLARGMLLSLLARVENRQVRFVETTISSSNAASKRLFESLAAALDTRMEPVFLFNAELFASAHETETVYRIGPFQFSHTEPKRKMI